MIHANTAERETLEEDFDMHAAIAQKNLDDQKAQKDMPSKDVQASSDDIDDLIDFSSLKGGKQNSES